ncbi:MAG: DUF2953 domain-containing protein [Lachnospiraceae bacterium]|nr:DUF2953 domain-containing protein [Lachnospiraceae bacterium]
MILLILKILGIILLSILCLILVVLAAVLFAAVTYRVRIQNSDTLCTTASVGWLFRAVTVNYRMDKAEQIKQDLKVCLFGIPVIKPLERKPVKKTGKKKTKKEKTKASVSEKKPVREDVMPEASIVETQKQPVSESVQKEEVHTKTKQKVSVWDRIRKIFRKVDLFIENLRCKIMNLQDTMRGFLDKKDQYLGFWNQEEHGRARSALWKEVLYVLKKTRPKKLEGRVLFGFEDPSVTGKCFGAASVFYAWYPKKFELVPDFEQEILECDIQMKGRIRLYIFVGILIRLLLNRDVRQMYQNWKQL